MSQKRLEEYAPGLCDSIRLSKLAVERRELVLKAFSGQIEAPSWLCELLESGAMTLKSKVDNFEGFEKPT